MRDWVAANSPFIRRGWGDGGYREYLVDHAAHPDIDLDIVRSSPEPTGLPCR
ncbi:hypothetical protein [Streptomyces venezuelae]|uniref:hypothetical protein n=1 Tax=Streptomyces venezuelae TaxID=54571 RepID=UPI0034170A80